MAIVFRFIRRPPVAGKAPPTIKRSPKHTLEGHHDTIWSLVFLHDNVHIVTGSYDNTMCKWDYTTGQLVGEPWKGKDSVLALALSPDGKTIACGRRDGSVQLWDTNGQLISEDTWTGHSDWVRSLSWSPSGGHLASGSFDGTILVREMGSGRVAVGPIRAEQGWVRSVAYSPLGDRIASSGDTICIWDSHTGNLLVGPIGDLRRAVNSVVWSSDGSKLYSASHKFALVFDSTLGTLLHRFQNDNTLFSIALSPQHNLLACVGEGGTAQLWRTESLQPVCDPLAIKEARNELHCVSFSPDGRYLAYGGYDNKITLWTVEDITDLPVAASSTNLQDGVQQTTLPKSQSSLSYVDDANILARPAVNDNQGCNNPYNEFFIASYSSLPSPSDPSPMRRLMHVFSALHLSTSESMGHKRFTRGVFQHPDVSTSDVLHAPTSESMGHKPLARGGSQRRTVSTPHLLPPVNSEQPGPIPKEKSRVVSQDKQRGNDNSFALRGAQRGKNKGTQREFTNYDTDDDSNSDLRIPFFFKLLFSCGHSEQG